MVLGKKNCVVTGMTLFGWNREPSMTSMTKHFSLVKYELFMSLGIWMDMAPSVAQNHIAVQGFASGVCFTHHVP